MAKVKKINYYGFDHAAVDNKFPGGLTYINDINIEGQVWALYFCENPDKEKGHKEYVLLTSIGGVGFVSGKTKKQLEKYKHVNAVRCTKCETILYSIHVHHYHVCDCGSGVFIDGGTDYVRCSVANTEQVTVNLLNDRLVRRRKK